MFEKASDIEIGWVVGMFEAEGCFHIKTERSGRKNGTVSIVSTDLDVLERVQTIVQAGRIYTVRGDSRARRWKECFTWRLQDFDSVYEFTDFIYPLLCDRRALKADEILSLKRPTRVCSFCNTEFSPTKLKSRTNACSDSCRKELSRRYMRKYRHDHYASKTGKRYNTKYSHEYA